MNYASTARLADRAALIYADYRGPGFRLSDADCVRRSVPELSKIHCKSMPCFRQEICEYFFIEILLQQYYCLISAFQYDCKPRGDGTMQ